MSVPARINSEYEEEIKETFDTHAGADGMLPTAELGAVLRAFGAVYSQVGLIPLLLIPCAAVPWY